jgi:uncharacterized membrane protein
MLPPAKMAWVESVVGHREAATVGERRSDQMRLLNRFARGELGLGRIEAFSDGVFAIVVTLLVLELRVPSLHNPGSVSELGHQLRELMPKFLSWLISFIIVCKFWLNHHHLLGLARYANYSMVWLNSLFLMCQSFIPFPTAMMGEYPTNPLAVSMFGLVMAVNTVMFIVLQAYVIRNLIKPDLADAQDPRLTLKSFVGVLSYLIGATAAWFSVEAAFLIYLLTPLFFIVPPAGRGIAPPGGAADAPQAARR